MSNAKVILYDVPTKGSGVCFSPNTWKTRLALNYKGIPYETKWLEYPEIETTLKAAGLEPHKEGFVAYSIPSIKLTETGEYFMDSRKIIDVLEERFPPAQLNVDSPIHAQMEQLFPKAVGPLRPIWMPRVPKVILNPESVSYFEASRARWYGMPLDEWAKLHAGPENITDAEPLWKEVATLLKKNGGPFLMGKEVSYADFYVLGWLRGFDLMGKDLLEQVFAFDSVLKDLYDASTVLFENDK